MPGSPLPAFGRERTAALALGGAGVLVTLLVGLGLSVGSDASVVGYGLLYAVATLSLYLYVRVKAGGLPYSLTNPRAMFVLALGTLGLVVQGALPAYLYVTAGYSSALGGLFLVTFYLYNFFFLRVGGDTDVIALYAFPVSLLGLVMTVLPVGAEFLLRALLF